jgi:hypothetical protein
MQEVFFVENGRALVSTKVQYITFDEDFSGEKTAYNMLINAEKRTRTI